MISIKNYVAILLIALLSGGIGACFHKEHQDIDTESVPNHVQQMKIEFIIQRKINAFKEVFFSTPKYKSHPFDSIHLLESKDNSHY